MSRFDPADFGRVPHAGMQATHEEELALFAALEQAVSAHREGGGPAEIDALLDAILAHVEEHFEGENRLMRETGFPPYPVHAGEHERVLAELRAVIAQWREGRDIDGLERALFDEHVAWMQRHIATMDTVTAQFIGMRAAGR